MLTMTDHPAVNLPLCVARAMRIARLLCAIVCIVLPALFSTGCGRAAGVIFEPLNNPPRWPGPPDTPRVRYVGQLRTNEDLKPARSFGELAGAALFGKDAPKAMLSPFAICTDNASRIFVADSNAQMVHVFDLSTRKYFRWTPSAIGQKFSMPVGISFDPIGKIYVTDSVAQKIFVFDTNGKCTGTIGESVLKRPVGICVHRATGRIYVTDTLVHQVIVFSATGQELVRVGVRGNDPGEFNFPTSVAIDRQGLLYVADTGNFRVQQIGPDMKSVKIIGKKGDQPGYFANPKAVAVDREDHLYVLDNQFESIQLFDSQGQLLMDFGEEGHGPGQFWLPGGLFVDGSDRIWVADAYNQRVQVFDYLPEGKP